MRKNLAAGISVILIAFAGHALPESTPQAPQVHPKNEPKVRVQNKNDADHDKGEGQTTTPTVSDRSGSEKPRQNGAEDGTQFSFFGVKLKLTDAVTLVFNGLLVGFTGLLWWSTRGLWKETRDAGATAKIAADAAKHSAEVAGNALERVERPYLFVYRLQTSMDSECGTVDDFVKESVITCSVSNHGRLPATVTRVRAGTCVTDNGVPQEVTDVENTHELLLDPILDASGTPRVVMFVGKEPLVLNRTAGEAVFFRVVISYDGPFTRDHECSFCWRIPTTEENQWRFIPFRDPQYTYVK